jgi:hypothetical protein
MVGEGMTTNQLGSNPLRSGPDHSTQLTTAHLPNEGPCARMDSKGKCAVIRCVLRYRAEGVGIVRGLPFPTVHARA